MNREPDDPIDDAETWHQPLTSEGPDPAVKADEPTAHNVVYSERDSALVGGEVLHPE